MSFIQSFLTPSGTNARRQQEQGQQAVGNFGGDIARGAGADYLSAMKFGRGLDPQMQSGLRYLANSTSTTGLLNNARTAGNQMLSHAYSQQLPMSTNPYLADAQRSQLVNQAQSQANQGIQHAFDPAAHAQALQGLMGALGQYKQNYGQDFQLGAGAVYGQPQVQVQPGVLDYAAQIGGLYSGIKSAGGGGHGGTNGGFSAGVNGALGGIAGGARGVANGWGGVPYAPGQNGNYDNSPFGLSNPYIGPDGFYNGRG